MSLEIYRSNSQQPRVAVYGRYSSKMQRVASLDDQYRVCRDAAKGRDFPVIDEYVVGDQAVPGKNFVSREQLQGLLTAAKRTPRPFDYLFVDEVSRLGRVQEKVLQMVRRFRQLGVKIYFVSQRLDSSDPHFSFALSFLAAQDEASNERLAHRVKRGHEGARLKGYSAGGFCYGYRTRPVLEAGREQAYSRADFSGYAFTIFEPEAAVVIRIFDLYADGMSTWAIALLLTEEGVESPKVVRGKPKGVFWTPTGIQQMLKNERYRGELVWNKRTTWFDHDEEKTRVTLNRPAEWRRATFPHLRIVSEELWQRVQDRIELVSRKFQSQRIGGLARAKKGNYPFSGLLFCGLCGGRLSILAGGVGRNASYGCISARYGRGCTNHLWIREDRLTHQLLSLLTDKLLVPKVLEELVELVGHEIDEILKSFRTTGVDTLGDLRARGKQLEYEVGRIVNQMLRPESEASEILPLKLKEKEAELKLIHSEIQIQSLPKPLSKKELNLHGLVNDNVKNIREILMSDFPKLRAVLQKYVHHLTLYPNQTESGSTYCVMGEIDLFIPPTGEEDRVLLHTSSTRALQQYTPTTESEELVTAGGASIQVPKKPIALDRVLRFLGEIDVYYQMPLPPSPVLKKLATLLRLQPDLLGVPFEIKVWCSKLNQLTPSEEGEVGPFTSAHLAQQFRLYTKILEIEFGMQKFLGNQLYSDELRESQGSRILKDRRIEYAFFLNGEDHNADAFRCKQSLAIHVSDCDRVVNSDALN